MFDTPNTFWWVEGALCHPLRRESMFFFFPMKGVEMSSPPSFQCYVAFFILLSLCILIQSASNDAILWVCRQEGYYSVHLKWREEINSSWRVEYSSKHAKHIAAKWKQYQELEKAHSASRRVRLRAYDEVEKSIYKSLLGCGARDVPVSRPMLQKKACDLAWILSVPNLATSSG